MKRNIKRKSFKCPKCGKFPVCFLEFWKGHDIAFDVIDGKVVKEGDLEIGNPCGVEAQCSCGHGWRLRGILQITDVKDILGVYDNGSND